MTTLADSLISSSSRPVRLRMRPDLTSEPQRYQGRLFYVIKEPVGLQYFRFQEEEYAVLEMLDGEASLDEIQHEFQRRFPPQKITLSELQQFIGMLHGNGLLICESPRQGEQLKKRADDRWSKEFMGAITNILSLRFKGIDPDWLLNKIYPWVAWFFTWPALFFCLAYGFTAMMLVAVNWDTFQSRLPAFEEFFGPSNWLWLALTLAVVKILHEFGHGLSCKHFGGECHEMGVMLLVLTPCLYCNVSDSWMLPNKWARAAIGAAGMYVELVIASTATFIWWYSEPGLLNYLCLRVMFICSVSTVLFNGNPLLRYDGYYIASDIMEIPNLQQKSSDVLRHMMSTWCLGLELPDDPFLPQQNQWLFALYTVASVSYRWLVFFSIMLLLNHIFEPYGLKVIGQMVVLAGIFGLVVMPMYQFYEFLNIPGRMDDVKMVNVLGTLGVVLAVVAAIVFIPLPNWIKCPVEVRPANATSVFVEAPGQLVDVSLEPLGRVLGWVVQDPDQAVDVNVQPGQSVAANALLARLSNIDLQMSIIDLEQRRAELAAQLENLEVIRFQEPGAAVQIPQVKSSIEAIDEQLATQRRDLERLRVRAPVAGTIFPPPWKSGGKRAEEQLPGWTGSPLAMVNRGAHLQPSELLLQIGDPKRVEAVAVIDQDVVELVREGQEVEVLFDAYPGQSFSSTVKELSGQDLKVTPNALASEGGGEVATRTDGAGRLRPLSTSYQARMPIDDPDHQLRVGMRGRVKIYTGWQPLWNRIWRYLSQTFHFKL